MYRSRRIYSLLRRFGPLTLVVLALAAFYGFGLNAYIGNRGFAEHYDAIMSWRDAHPVSSALIFAGLYISIVAISVPASLWMSVPGGLLFGWFVGGLLSWGAATLGATLAFLVARNAINPAQYGKKDGPYVRFKAGFERNAFSFIIILRLMPLPFFVVNMAAGTFHVPVRTFALASAIGLIPASFLFAALGETAAEVLRAGGKLDSSFFLQPKIMVVFIGFASLALLPLIIRHFRKDDNP